MKKFKLFLDFQSFIINFRAIIFIFLKENEEIIPESSNLRRISNWDKSNSN